MFNVSCQAGAGPRATRRYPLESGTLCVSSNHPQKPIDHFPSLDSHSACDPWLSGSLADRKVCLQQRHPTPGARHAPFAQREPPSVKTGQDGLMGAWIATNSSIAIRTEASKCSSLCSCGSLGSQSPFTCASSSGHDSQCARGLLL